MRTGVELLEAARGMSPEEIELAFGLGGSNGPRGMERAALVAALLSSFTPADRALIRHLTLLEMAAVGDADAGSGETLLACCWLLFMLGEVEDAELVWRAKQVNFDTHCYIDSVFLIPQGVQATAKFARAHGVKDLAAWVDQDWLSDPEEGAQQWRTGSFFASVPRPETSAVQLAAWLRS